MRSDGENTPAVGAMSTGCAACDVIVAAVRHARQGADLTSPQVVHIHGG